MNLFSVQRARKTAPVPPCRSVAARANAARSEPWRDALSEFFPKAFRDLTRKKDNEQDTPLF